MAAARGAKYEVLAVRTLAQQIEGLTLTHCGGRDDAGMDFVGRWALSASMQVPVVGQCKNHQRVLGPGVVREMASVVERADAFGFLVSASGFSRQALSSAQATATALLLVTMDAAGGEITALAMNDATGRLFPGLTSGSVLGKGGRRRPVLLYEEHILFGKV